MNLRALAALPDWLGRLLSHPACWGAALLACIAVLLAQAHTPLHQAVLEPASIRAEQGKAWLAPVPPLRSRWYRAWGPDVGRTASGSLLLLEDGVPTPGEGAAHAQIRELGAGRYSHWGNGIYFSTRDSSDPRSNGRVYTVQVEAQLRSRWLLAGAVLALYAPIGAAAWLRRRGGTAAVGLRRGLAAVVGLAAVLLALQALSWTVPVSRTHVFGPGVSASLGNLRVADLRPFGWAGLLTADRQTLMVSVGGRLLPAPSDEAAPAARLRAGAAILVVPAAADQSVEIHADWRAAPALMGSTLALLLLAMLWRSLLVRGDARPAGSLFSLLGPRVLGERWSLLFALAGGLLGAGLLWNLWRLGASGHLGAAALLPVSDALGYFRCALLAAEPSARELASLPSQSLAHYGMPAEWCSRRTIWPMSLLTLLWSSGWRSGVALLVQAALIGAALGIAVREAWRLFGLVAALALAAVGVLFAIEWAIGTFMTEVYGLAAGFAGAALLMRHAEQRDTTALVVGLALISLALAARAGALFALPLLALWGYLTLRPPGRWLAPRAVVVVALSLAAGPLLQWLGALHYLGEAINTGGNFAASLYGLSTGSRDWSQAYRDFAPLFATRPESEVFAHIQQKAIENIRAEPDVLIESLRQAGMGFLRQPFAMTDGLAASDTPAALMWIGTLYALWHWRQPRFALLLAVFAAECLAAPLIIDSGGARVFAATMWVRPLLAGVGLLALSRLLAALLRQPVPPPAASGATMPPWTAYALAALLALLPLLPLLAPAASLRPPTTTIKAQCRSDETPLVARPGRESLALSIGSPRQAPVDVSLVVAPGRVEGDAVWRGSWWAGAVGPLPPGRSLLIAFDAQRDSRGRVLALVVDEPLLPDENGLLPLCAGPSTGRPLGDLGLQQARPAP